MRIGLIIERIDAWRGGAETSTGQFLAHLLARGIEVHLITRSRVPVRPGLVVHRVATPQSAPHVLKTYLFLRRTAELAKRLDADLLHTVTPCAAADIYEPRAGTVCETIRRNVAMRRTPFSKTLKRLSGRLNLRQQLLLREERRLLRRPAPPHVVAVSDYVARQLREHYRLDSSRVSVIFNGVDPMPSDESIAEQAARLRRLYGVGQDGRLVLCVANNFRLKGVGPAIESIARLRQASDLDATLVIIGRDNPLPYKRLAERSGAADRVHFAGHTERIAAFYAAADVLLHPTWFDPCSRVVLEALSVGLRCVTTRFNGAAEIIDGPSQGYVIDSPDDIDALVDRLTRVLKTPRSAMAPACGEPPDRRFSMERHTDQVVALYERLLSAKAKR